MAESEIARTRAQIDAENAATRLALTGTAYGTPQHRFITKRMEQTGEQALALIAEIGEQAAMPLVFRMMERDAEECKPTQ